MNWKTKFKHSPPTLKPNKRKLKMNTLTFNEVNIDEFNKIYNYCKKHYTCVKCTQSKGITTNIKYRFKERYTVICMNQSYELVVNCLEGDYRFVLKNQPHVLNTIKGRKAALEIYKQADKYGIDMNKYKSDNGSDIKKQINSPHIKFMLPERFIGKPIHNVHHLDLNSAYASEIIKKYPEFKDMYNDIYNKRKDDNGYFKHVLTNSIGAFQSEYCPDYKTRHKSTPYLFSELSKTAVNGTRATIEKLLIKMRKKGCVPILTNTDGIWYTGPLYHDSDEGIGLCQWKNDHKNCDFIIKGTGAYQYVENGKCVSVVKGLSNLDILHERTDWEFGEIINNELEVEKYRFTEEEGVTKVWVKV